MDDKLTEEYRKRLADKYNVVLLQHELKTIANLDKVDLSDTQIRRLILECALDIKYTLKRINTTLDNINFKL